MWLTRLTCRALAGSIPGIDVVQPLLFNIWDESKSVYFQANVKAFNPNVDQADAGFAEGNLKHGINGYVFCNMPDVSLLQNALASTLRIDSYVGGIVARSTAVYVAALHEHYDLFAGYRLHLQHRGCVMLFPHHSGPVAQVRVKQGGTVRWMLIGMGTENDMHSPIFQGQVRAAFPALLT